MVQIFISSIAQLYKLNSSWENNQKVGFCREHTAASTPGPLTTSTDKYSSYFKGARERGIHCAHEGEKTQFVEDM